MVDAAAAWAWAAKDAEEQDDVAAGQRYRALRAATRAILGRIGYQIGDHGDGEGF